MTITTEERSTTASPPVDGRSGEFGPDDWELDVTFIESGESVDKLIYMTNDGCGKTCQSACSTTCPK
ncbi:FxLD family lanthipeptide [Verrucosispora sp. NA02020]|uniref:FxLD family lanthipeptide n=1 Tax=Verrucosispora sp. NA02020 TaxID=2742132 RepID=UPI0015903CC3|nr:FxLD family lanthipeptide [Verrucosispora sp. NA02020]QKW12217.1 FxLD family lantipeptide [Verrucosispora sp. NA02020]